MQPIPAKPVFVVGSPRSGTSILTWCLGQHPNIFPVPESNWMGPFAVNLAISYQVGSARALLSILSAMGISEDEFFSHIGQSINGLIMKHRCDLDRQRLITGAQRILKDKGLYMGEVTGELNPAMNAAVQVYLGHDRLRDPPEADILGSLHTILESDSKTLWIDTLNSELKSRWVDGTPEYSWHIYGLRKLFPDALFIHIVRDAFSVVQSMLNFHRVAGTHLVASEEEAYRYWLGTVNACLTAERAYGPRVIHRLKYSDLIGNPETALQSLLDFLGEPYSAKCLEPLTERINSSNVPADFRREDSATASVVVEEAIRLSRNLEQSLQPAEASLAAAAEMEAVFAERIQYMATLDGQYQRALQIIQTVEQTKVSEKSPFYDPH
jgi:sulfotransferase family protein